MFLDTRSLAVELIPFPLAEAGPQIRLLSRGSEPATEAEITANPRAASVRVRATTWVPRITMRPAGAHPTASAERTLQFVNGMVAQIEAVRVSIEQRFGIPVTHASADQAD